MATVRYENASRIYAGTEQPAVDGLDLDIGDGEFLVLVGPSGRVVSVSGWRWAARSCASRRSS
jgi:ABC-type nitrate/sulfonate/bicarbonate transport system ATPase subunit